MRRAALSSEGRFGGDSLIGAWACRQAAGPAAALSPSGPAAGVWTTLPPPRPAPSGVWHGQNEAGDGCVTGRGAAEPGRQVPRVACCRALSVETAGVGRQFGHTPADVCALGPLCFRAGCAGRCGRSRGVAGRLVDEEEDRPHDHGDAGGTTAGLNRLLRAPAGRPAVVEHGGAGVHLVCPAGGDERRRKP